jgi:uncharacterized membrane protein
MLINFTQQSSSTLPIGGKQQRHSSFSLFLVYVALWSVVGKYLLFVKEEKKSFPV